VVNRSDDLGRDIGQPIVFLQLTVTVKYVAQNLCNEQDRRERRLKTVNSMGALDEKIRTTAKNQVPDHERLDDEDVEIEEMLRKLSSEELEIAARSSFRYLLRRAGIISSADNRGDADNKTAFYCKNSLEEDRDQQARAMAQRYLRSKKNPAKALANMKETLLFRQQNNVDTLRLCFAPQHALEALELDIPQAARFRAHLKETLSRKELYVQGFDSAGRRALWICVARKTSHFGLDAYIRDAIYVLERAIACSERESDGQQHEITAVIDYAGFSLTNHNPPLDVNKHVLHNLRRHYVGRVNRIYMINAHWSLRTLWTVLKPFAGSETRRKICFVAPEDQLALGSSLVDAPAWVTSRSSTDIQEEPSFDLKRFLHDIPFDRTYTPASK
jgi:CRAL/TRIO domain